MLVHLLFLVLWTEAMISSRSKALALKDYEIPDIANETFTDLCVSVHNMHRSRVKPPAKDMMYMTWDETLAKSASDWAKNCMFSHNPSLQEPFRLHPNFRSVGENIWWGSPLSIFTIEGAVKLWTDEVKDYTYATRTCSAVCSHYTQVVWAKSYKVGCAVASCSGGTAAIFVCNYGEAGNLAGSYPYTKGAACSGCTEKCWANLCYDPKLVKLKKYTWETDASSDSSCGPFCIAVLTIRPLLGLFTVLGVQRVQRVYPNIFAYE